MCGFREKKKNQKNLSVSGSKGYYELFKSTWKILIHDSRMVAPTSSDFSMHKLWSGSAILNTWCWVRYLVYVCQKFGVAYLKISDSCDL